MTGPLIPAAVEARARGRRRLPFGFGPRFFVALVLGLLWLIPAWWSPRLIAGMFLWDAVVVGIWLYDLLRLPPPSQVEVRRSWQAPLSLARGNRITVELTNHGVCMIEADLVDETPHALRDEPPAGVVTIPGGGAGRWQYDILPRERGDTRLGALFLRYRSAMGCAERWACADLGQTVRILPDLVEAKDQALYLIRSRQIEMEKRRRRQRGMGREFECLRDYRIGDDPRDICWPATARHHRLTTRVYESERSQTVWVVVDAGRLSRAQVGNTARPVPLSKLDYAVNAALSLAQVASQSGDRVGLVAYGRAVQQAAAAARGPHQVRVLVDALAQVRAEPAEASHSLAARTLLTRQTRRSLVVWITDFAETPATPEVIESAMQVSRRHLVLFAAVSQPDLADLAARIPQTAAEMYRYAAATEIVERRDLLLRGLRQNGILAMELTPGALTPSLVNQYLEIKDRSML